MEYRWGPSHGPEHNPSILWKKSSDAFPLASPALPGVNGLREGVYSNELPTFTERNIVKHTVGFSLISFSLVIPRFVYLAPYPATLNTIFLNLAKREHKRA